MKGAVTALLARLRRAQAAMERAVLRPFLAVALRSASKEAGAPPSDTADILVLRPDEIGDMVLALPLLRALRLRYPRARLSLVAQGAPGRLAMELGLADEWIPLKGGRPYLPVLQSAWRAWLLARSLRGRRFGLVLFPRWGADFRQAGILAALLPADRKVCFASEASREQADWECVPKGVWRQRVLSLGAHEADHILDFMAALDLAKVDGKARRLSSVSLRRQAALLLSRRGGGPWLAVAPFARSLRRVWPVERWAALVLDLAAEWRLRPFVLAGPGEASEADTLGRLLGKGTPVFSLGLRQSAALLSRARLFAGANSAHAHMAAAEGRPCLVINCHPKGAPPWHDNAPERFGPWGVESLVLGPAVHAWPCTRGCDAFVAHCILGLDVKSARDAAVAWRNRRPKA